MDNYIKNIVIRKCDDNDKLNALGLLENDIEIAKKIISGECSYCTECDDYYLSKSFIQERECKKEKICKYCDPINSGGNEYKYGKVEYLYLICPKGHKYQINRREL